VEENNFMELLNQLCNETGTSEKEEAYLYGEYLEEEFGKMRIPEKINNLSYVEGFSDNSLCELKVFNVAVVCFSILISKILGTHHDICNVIEHAFPNSSFVKIFRSRKDILANFIIIMFLNAFYSAEVGNKNPELYILIHEYIILMKHNSDMFDVVSKTQFSVSFIKLFPIMKYLYSEVRKINCSDIHDTILQDRLLRSIPDFMLIPPITL
jgi:hypothetical protein